jgi:hypothetical protein
LGTLTARLFGFKAWLRKTQTQLNDWNWREKEDGCDRDRTDDLYRVNVAGVVYLNHSSWLSLFDFGAIYMMFALIVPKLFPDFRPDPSGQWSWQR